jgi:Ankyrin repeats (3 copies)/Ankyrin repeats (many copies)
MSRFNVFQEYLFNSVQSNHLLSEELLIMAMNSVDVNARDEKRKTLLHYAIINENFFLVKLFIEAGALVNQIDGRGRTPLRLAAINCNYKIMKYLLEHGADIELGNDDGYTLLHAVVNEGKLDCVKLLIDHGARLNAQNNENRYTPLHCAVLEKDIKIVALLLEKGADPYARDKDHATSVHFIVEGIIDSKDVDVAIQMLKLLVKVAKKDIFDMKNNEGNTPLALLNNRRALEQYFMSCLEIEIFSQNQIGIPLGLNVRFFNTSASQSKEDDETLEPPKKRLKTY